MGKLGLFSTKLGRVTDGCSWCFGVDIFSFIELGCSVLGSPVGVATKSSNLESWATKTFGNRQQVTLADFFYKEPGSKSWGFVAHEVSVTSVGSAP